MQASEEELGHVLQSLISDLKAQIAAVEARAERAEQAARHAEELVLALRDEIAAAQRDQQDLRAARASLNRLHLRGLFARIRNRR